MHFWHKYRRIWDALLIFGTLLLAMTTPLTYLYVEYCNKEHRVAFYAERYVFKFKHAIEDNPQYWQLSIGKYIEALVDIESEDGIAAIEVYDPDNKLVHREELLTPSVLLITKRVEIRYNNRLYGSVVIYGSAVSIVWRTLLVLCACSIMTFAVLKMQKANQQSKHEIAISKEIENVMKQSQAELSEKNNELMRALATLKHTQNQLVQHEKMAGIGQLAAGIAHEINNPLGFVTSNVEMLQEYWSFAQRLGNKNQEILLRQISESLTESEVREFEFILADLPGLFEDTLDGLKRMASIVKGMRHYSHMNVRRTMAHYDLIAGLESAILIAQSEINHYARVERQFAKIPLIEAVGDEINQVLLNIIINAVHAIKEKGDDSQGVITIATWADLLFVYCSVKDTGTGINPDDVSCIFNPFFTTKAVGHGTGMGLSISYDIIVNRHKGEISVESQLGNGAAFIIKLPIKHSLI